MDEVDSKKDLKHRVSGGQDNALMLVDTKASLDQHKAASVEEHSKQKSSSPSSGNVSPSSASPRPGMGLPRSGSACSDLQSRRRKLAMIRKSLKPFAHSDPGFNHSIVEKANKRFLEDLCLLGYDEVRLVCINLQRIAKLTCIFFFFCYFRRLLQWL